jgi:hypothetical protein
VLRYSSETDKFADLTEEERQIILRRLEDPGNDNRHKFERSALRRCFSTRTTYLHAIMWLSVNLTLASLSGFFATILVTFGYSPARAELFSVPPYALS